MADIKIINTALTLIGRQILISLNENTEEAVLATNMFDTALESVLSKGHWTKVTYRTELAGNGTPAFEFTNSFALPVDPKFISLISVKGGGEHRIEGSSILTNTTKCYIKYVGKPKNPSTATLGPLLSEAVAYELAVYISRALHGSANVSAGLIAEADRILKTNLARDANQGTKKSILSSAYIDVRK